MLHLSHCCDAYGDNLEVMMSCLQPAWLVARHTPTNHRKQSGWHKHVCLYTNMGPERHAPFPGAQIGSITTTGHSLGGALAALCAADIADCLNSTPAAEAAALPSPLERLQSPPAAALAGLAATAVKSTQKAAASAAALQQGGGAV